jgi:hypothetical protein
MVTKYYMRMNHFFNPPRLQLWSDPAQEHFAVRLSGDVNFRAVSNPGASYIMLVDEADFFYDMEYDWNYLLTHWMSVRNGEIKIVDADEEVGHVKSESPDRLDGKRGQKDEPKANLKCRFCELCYKSEKSRSEHEAAWHADKVGAQALS